MTYRQHRMHGLSRFEAWSLATPMWIHWAMITIGIAMLLSAGYLFGVARERAAGCYQGEPEQVKWITVSVGRSFGR